MLLEEREREQEKRIKSQRTSQNEILALFKLVKYRNPDCLLSLK